MYLFELYHQLIKKKSGEVKPFNPLVTWPKEWKEVVSKEYERFPLIQLNDPATGNKVDTPLVEVIYKRRSGRSFGHSVSEEQLSKLLYYSLGESKNTVDKSPRRMYPSAGARYPLEGYLLLFKSIGTLSRGVYHYNVATHGLRKLRADSLSPEDLVAATAEVYLENATGALILSANWARSSAKYGERTYKLILLEAGAVFQNAALLACAQGLEAVQVGTFAEDVIEPLLDIDGHQETYLHALFFG